MAIGVLLSNASIQMIHSANISRIVENYFDFRITKIFNGKFAYKRFGFGLRRHGGL